MDILLLPKSYILPKECKIPERHAEGSVRRIIFYTISPTSAAGQEVKLCRHQLIGKFREKTGPSNYGHPESGCGGRLCFALSPGVDLPHHDGIPLSGAAAPLQAFRYKSPPICMNVKPSLRFLLQTSEIPNIVCPNYCRTAAPLGARRFCCSARCTKRTGQERTPRLPSGVPPHNL